MNDLRAEIGYSERTERRPYFYANAHEKDFVPLRPVEVPIADMRGKPTSLDEEGCVLVRHRSEVADFADPEQIALIHAPEIEVSQAVLDEADRLINHDTVSGHRYHDAIRPTIDTEEFEDA